MAIDPKPWYAHEYPDRPLVEGAFLYCCLLCAVSLERSAQKDAFRPILFHTGWGTWSWSASLVASQREDTNLHEMLGFTPTPAGNWVKAVRVGHRPGRARKNWPRDHRPFPLERWPVCAHCGPLSDATFAELTPLGGPRGRRPSPKQLAADEGSRVARHELVIKVEAAMEQHKTVAANQQRDERRPLRALADATDEFDDEW